MPFLWILRLLFGAKDVVVVFLCIRRYCVPGSKARNASKRMGENDANQANYEELQGHISILGAKLKQMIPEGSGDKLEDLEDNYERLLQMRVRSSPPCVWCVLPHLVCCWGPFILGGFLLLPRFAGFAGFAGVCWGPFILGV